MKSDLSQVICVIPARYGSQRFEGKVLKPLAGKPLIQWVWLRAKEAQNISRVIIATDDERVLKTVESFGGEAVMTDPALPSGTDRVAVAIENIEANFVINLQGDEPLFPSQNLNNLAQYCLDYPDMEMATFSYPLKTWEDVDNPNIVKVVVGDDENALYFSRAPIPFLRDTRSPEPPAGLYRKHLGIYAYKREVLEKLVILPPSTLEKTEKLEQLRALEAGITIQVLPSISDSVGVDTPHDLELAEKILYQK